MVCCGGTARKGEFGQRGGSRNENIFGLDARPDRVEGLEPVEEVGILRGRDSAREGLVEVMVGVDEPRQDDVIFEVKHFIGTVGQTGSLPYFFNEAAANEKTTIREFGLVVVHGEEVGVLDEESSHEFVAVSFSS